LVNIITRSLKILEENVKKLVSSSVHAVSGGQTVIIIIVIIIIMKSRKRFEVEN